ncbi:MAG: hypothetical protein U0572_04975 [Phycisphaerales bacterium]
MPRPLALTPLTLAATIAVAVALAPAGDSLARADDPPAGSPTTPPVAPADPAAASPEASAPATPFPKADAIDVEVKAPLGRLFSMLGARSVRKNEIALADIELSLLLAEAATPLNPDDVNTWRSLLAILSLCDPTDDRIAASRRAALDQIGRLDPTDQTILLRRIVESIERKETAEARIAAYRSLLQPANVEKLGKPIAARLSFDLALLLQRTGDQQGFEEALSESVALDPTFPAAVQMAAGYFRLSTEDPAKEAELLVAAMLANPLDPNAMRAFATDLLERGAYANAARFLSLAARAVATDLPATEYDELLGDLALAQLASGDAKAAAETVRARQFVLNETFRQMASERDSTLLGDPERRRALKASLRPAILAVQIAALNALGKNDECKTAKAELPNTYSQVLERDDAAEKDAKSPDAAAAVRERRKERALEAAFATIWLSEDAEKAKEYFQRAQEGGDLADAAKARFQAWLTLRAGDAKAALEAFSAIDDQNPMTQLGKALALDAMGSQRDAAREFLALSRSEPGTLMGVIAKMRLEAILGTPLPLAESALAVDRVAAQVPSTFDRLFQPNARTIRMRFRSGAMPENVFGALPVSLELANDSPFPLAIDPDGPIRNFVIFQPTLSAAGRDRVHELDPVMIPLDRAFAIGPGETLSVPIDLSNTDVGFAMLGFSAQGCSIRGLAVSNCIPTTGGMKPGPFGDTADSGMLRVDGVALTKEWLDRTLKAAANPVSFRELVDVVALAYAASALGAVSDSADTAQKEQKATFDQIWTILPQTIVRLGPVAQAWLLMVLPDNQEPLDATLKAVRSAEDPLVRLAYLTRRVASSTDPAVDAAVRSPNPVIANYGRVVKEMLLSAEAQSRRDLDVGGSSGREAPASRGTSAPAGGSADPSAPSKR